MYIYIYIYLFILMNYLLNIVKHGHCPVRHPFTRGARLWPPLLPEVLESCEAAEGYCHMNLPETWE